MGKRRSSLDDGQLGFTFEAPVRPCGEADLAGLGRWTAAAVARALNEDSRSRAEIAGAMSALLDEEVTKFMLDAYASEARGEHNIPAHRWMALVAVTEHYDLLDAMVRRIGASLLVGPEIITAELGQVDRQMAALKARRQRIVAAAPIIERERAQR